MSSRPTRNGEVVSLKGRFEAQMAGARHILLVNNVQVLLFIKMIVWKNKLKCVFYLQEDDYGTYMCYATNSLGSVQKLLEVVINDQKLTILSTMYKWPFHSQRHHQFPPPPHQFQHNNHYQLAAKN